MFSDNEEIKYRSVNAHFCNTPAGFSWTFFDMLKKKILNEEEESPGGQLLTLLNVREYRWCIPQFGIDEINEVIDYVCTPQTYIGTRLLPLHCPNVCIDFCFVEHHLNYSYAPLEPRYANK